MLFINQLFRTSSEVISLIRHLLKLILLIFFRNELVHFLINLFLFLLLTTHKSIEDLWIVIVDVLIDSSLESLHQFLFDLLLNVGSDECLGLSDAIPLLCLLLDGNQLLLSLQLELPHLDQHLPQFGQSLLALMYDKRRPINQLLVDLLQSFGI